MWDEFCSLIAMLFALTIIILLLLGPYYIDLKKESMKATPCKQCGHVNTKEKK